MPSSGPSSDLEDQSACHTQACRLQGCLQRNTYAPDKCEWAVHALWKCCGHFYQSRGINLDPDVHPLQAAKDRHYRAQLDTRWNAGSDAKEGHRETPDACPLPGETLKKIQDKGVKLG